MSTKFGNKRTVLRGESDWPKNVEWMTESGTDVEVVILIATAVILKTSVLGKRVDTKNIMTVGRGMMNP
jgi:hypothetical protein